jgi:hypothetical protein
LEGHLAGILRSKLDLSKWIVGSGGVGYIDAESPSQGMNLTSLRCSLLSMRYHGDSNPGNSERRLADFTTTSIEIMSPRNVTKLGLLELEANVESAMGYGTKVCPFLHAFVLKM